VRWPAVSATYGTSALRLQDGGVMDVRITASATAAYSAPGAGQRMSAWGREEPIALAGRSRSAPRLAHRC
jgi:hypothetical protein